MLSERHSSPPRRRMYAGSRIVCEETSPNCMRTSFTAMGELFDHTLPVIYAPLSKDDGGDVRLSVLLSLPCQALVDRNEAGS